MNIDERLDRLTARHEALTGHVELLTADLAQFSVEMRQTKERIDDLAADSKRQQKAMGDLMLAVSSLVELARSHEHRIDRLESR
jgi:prephenate dehydrogenase